MLIDTHAHIYLEHFNQDMDEMIERSRRAGIRKIYLPNIDHTSIDRMLCLEEKYKDLCIPMIGLHPCSIKSDFEKDLSVMESWLAKRKFAGIGETGIDLYWDKTYFNHQIEALKIQISWAKKYMRPIILHCRGSIQQTIDVITSEVDRNLTGIFHCFTGTYDQAQEIISLGFLLGIGGVVTFKSSNLDDVVEKIDLEHIVLETDSPYLAPVPKRGKRNEPCFLTFIAEKIADIKGITLGDVKERTSQNALNLFREWE
jgi:TatD DNase family protein